MINLAIVGAGAMGRNHGRVAMGLRDARVAVVVDPSEEAGKALAAACGSEYAPSIADIDKVDAAVISVPTDHHVDIGLALMSRGIGVLIEKPIAPTVGDAQRLMDAAKEHGVVLMVGHVERFNPAIAELETLVDQPVHFEAARISPFVARIGDGVILDLMIHDLDIIRALAASEVSHIQAIATSVVSKTEDLAVALIQFESGATASLTASRVGQEKIRRLSVTQRDNYIVADLLRHDVTLNRVEEVGYTDGQGYRQRGVVEIPLLQHRGEPLFLELEHFVQCAQTGEEPKVPGHDGLAALSLAMEVRAAAGV